MQPATADLEDGEMGPYAKNWKKPLGARKSKETDSTL